MSAPTSWSAEKLTSTAQVISALDSPLRLQILLMLHNRDHVVHELVGSLAKSQPLISQHLRVLKDAGLVDSSRAGREVIYRLAVPGIIATVESIAALGERADEVPEADLVDELAARRKSSPDFIDASESVGSAAAFGPLGDHMPDVDPGLKPGTPTPPR